MSLLFRIEALYNVYKRLELAERYNEQRRQLGLDVSLMMDLEARMNGQEPDYRSTLPILSLRKTRKVGYTTAMLLTSIHKAAPNTDTTKVPVIEGYDHAS